MPAYQCQMLLSASLQVNAGEFAVNDMLQGWNVDLCQVHVDFLGSVNASHRLPVHYRQIEQHR